MYSAYSPSLGPVLVKSSALYFTLIAMPMSQGDWPKAWIEVSSRTGNGCPNNRVNLLGEFTFEWRSVDPS